MDTLNSRRMEQTEWERVQPPSLRPEASTVRVERIDGEGFAAGFTLRLTSAVADAVAAANPLAYDGFLLEHTLAALDPGQQVRFVFRCRGAGAGPAQVAFEVRGQAVSTDVAAAQASALALYDVLTRLLAARADCRFAPVVEPEAAFGHRYRLDAEGVMLTAQAGPAVRANVPAPLILPALSLVEARVPFWDALLGCSFPVEIDVSLRPVRLDDGQLKAIAGTIGMLGETRLRYEYFPERRPMLREQVHPLNDWFKQELERWLRLAVGVELDVEFATMEPVSPGALRWLAQTLMPTRRFTVRRAEEAAPTVTAAVDLRTCLNESKIMPALLPDRETVQRIGLSMSFLPPQTPLATTGIVLGKTAETKVRLPASDRERHCYLVGATGCGKSTLLRNLILQDIEAGEGVCLVDPHGDLFREVLDTIPRRRAKDVVLLDPTDFDRAVGLNYLEIPGVHPAMERSFITNEMIKILDRLYDLRVTGGPMFESYTRFGLLLLMESRIPGLTLVEFPYIFESEDYRKWLVRQCTNRAATRFWSEQAERAGGDGTLQNWSVYVTSKFNQFTGNALLRNIVGQSRSTIDFRAAMDGRKILLINLSKGMLGEFDSALLGMLIVSKLFVAALGRARMPREARHPFHLYIDEFQNFTTDTVAHLLSEARKFGLRLMLANQHLTQIQTGNGSGNLAAAVLGNVGTILAMRLGAADADALRGVLGQSVSACTLQNLPDFHAAARLLQGGRPATPFIFQTLAPGKNRVDRMTQATIQRAYVRDYTHTTEWVEREIGKRAELHEQDD